MAELDMVAVAREMVLALDNASLVPPLTQAWPDLDFETAYRIAAECKRLRRARGERPVGRKIGYTNRNMWAQYDVHQPIWDYVYAHTVQRADANAAVQPLAGMVAPRIEPEIAFGLSAPPPAGCTDPAVILQSCEWVARAFEIVDCHYSDWKFRGPDSVIDFSHHAALIVGEANMIRKDDIARLARELRDCKVTIVQDDVLADAGTGAAALGHPALALAHLVDVLASQPAAPLEAGEIVTTGSLTAALPVERGETWRTDTEGLSLPSLTVTFD